MERARWTRLRWRLRGAWQWPAFALATPAEAVLLNALPVWGDGPGGVVPGLLLAGFMNLIVVAALAPLAGRALRRGRPDLPRPIANDYAGAALIGVLFASLLTSGLAHHGEITAEREARAAQLVAVAHYVESRAPQYRSRLAQADTMRVDRDVYRTCLPGPDPNRWLCLIVDTDRRPPAITRDRDAAPNAVYQRHGGFR